MDRISQADKRPPGKPPYARSEKKGVYTKKLRGFPVGIDAAADPMCPWTLDGIRSACLLYASASRLRARPCACGGRPCSQRPSLVVCKEQRGRSASGDGRNER